MKYAGGTVICLVRSEGTVEVGGVLLGLFQLLRREEFPSSFP